MTPTAARALILTWAATPEAAARILADGALALRLAREITAAGSLAAAEEVVRGLEKPPYEGPGPALPPVQTTRQWEWAARVAERHARRVEAREARRAEELRLAAERRAADVQAARVAPQTAAEVRAAAMAVREGRRAS